MERPSRRRRSLVSTQAALIALLSLGIPLVGARDGASDQRPAAGAPNEWAPSTPMGDCSSTTELSYTPRDAKRTALSYEQLLCWRQAGKQCQCLFEVGSLDCRFRCIFLYAWENIQCPDGPHSRVRSTPLVCAEHCEVQPKAVEIRHFFKATASCMSQCRSAYDPPLRKDRALRRPGDDWCCAVEGGCSALAPGDPTCSCMTDAARSLPKGASTPTPTSKAATEETATETPIARPTDDENQGSVKSSTSDSRPREHLAGRRSCEDHTDNDGDSLVDCEDPDCRGLRSCAVPVPVSKATGLVLLVIALLSIALRAGISGWHRSHLARFRGGS
jgi:hypothetical protein